ncbi:MAG: HNH endonuclease [Candidatus Solibacter sp.]|nr:HNH endonuclease [Candidatus Solibacter sp.]
MIYVVGGHGLFATARIKSRPKPRTDWENRHGADLESVRLIEPPISLAALRRRVPDLKWANYPRSITTPSHKIVEQIRALIGKRRETGIPDIEDEDIPSANIDELWTLALLRATSSATKKERVRVYRVASTAIRNYVLHRAKGHCEACEAAAPFRTPDGEPFLETHHTTRLADDGPDHPAKVIGLCPNCHRRAHLSKDAKSFNASLIRKLPRLVLAAKNTD